MFHLTSVFKLLANNFVHGCLNGDYYSSMWERSANDIECYFKPMWMKIRWNLKFFRHYIGKTTWKVGYCYSLVSWYLTSNENQVTKWDHGWFFLILSICTRTVWIAKQYGLTRNNWRQNSRICHVSWGHLC